MDRHIYLVLIGLAFLKNKKKLATKKIYLYHRSRPDLIYHSLIIGVVPIYTKISGGKGVSRTIRQSSFGVSCHDYLL